MAIPSYERIMLPLLNLCEDQQIHKMSALQEELADFFGLTDDERNERLPGGQRKFSSRFYWAGYYLRRALLLHSPERGYLQITSRGLKLLEERPDVIDSKLLRRYPEFVRFKFPTKTEASIHEMDEEDGTRTDTPIEILEATYLELRQSLVEELLEQTGTRSPGFFERLVIDVLLAMGYGGSREDAGEALGTSGDGGLDGLIKEDRLGLDVLYIQAKRWSDPVGRPVVQGFAGSLDGVGTRKGVLITTSRFTSDAIEYVNRIDKRIILIDGRELAELMIDYGVGVTDVAVYTIRRIDQDYFDED
ncbi:MAG: restriction endonuclease [Firmicutes bacterium]|jgi:restriction system protein|nr:restriction endonuclease [Bacillota bacterium]